MRRSSEKRIADLSRQSREPRKVLRAAFRELIDNFDFLSKENWVEVFQAVFASTHYLERGVGLDFKLLTVWQRTLEQLQRNNSIRSDIEVSSAARMLYSILMFTIMNYIYNPAYSRAELEQEVDAELEILLKGLAENRELPKKEKL